MRIVITYGRERIIRVSLSILLEVISMSSFASPNLASRDRFGRPSPRQPLSILHTQAKDNVCACLKKNQNAPKPSQHSPVRGGKCQNVYVGFKRVPLHWVNSIISGRSPPLYCCVCVCFLPIHSRHQVRWTYQPGSHRGKVTGFFIHLLSAVRALNFLARRI
ncbi:unnamed protein product [Ascophyllum nodosum]